MSRNQLFVYVFVIVLMAFYVDATSTTEHHSLMSSLSSTAAGIVTDKTSHFFNSNMNLKKTVDTLLSDDFVWNAVLNDLSSEEQSDEYLEIISKECSDFRRKNKMWGCDHLADAVRMTMATKGQLIFLTGGPGTGKSLFLREFSRLLEFDKSHRITIIIEGRMNSKPIHYQILSSLSLIPTIRTMNKFWSRMKSLFNVATKSSPNNDSFVKDVLASLATSFKESSPTGEALVSMVKIILEENIPLEAILIDDAHEVISPGLFSKKKNTYNLFRVCVI